MTFSMRGVPLATDDRKALRQARARTDKTQTYPPPDMLRPANYGFGEFKETTPPVVGVVQVYKRQELATTIARRANDSGPTTAVKVPEARSPVDRALGTVVMEVMVGKKHVLQVDRTTDLDDEAPLPTRRVAYSPSGGVRHVMRPSEPRTICGRETGSLRVEAAHAVPFWVEVAYCKRCTR